MNMRPLTLILGATALVIACGGGSSSGGEGGSSSNTFATEYCDLTGGVCCPKQGQTYNGQTCRALVSLASVQEGTTFDAVAASQCITALRAAQSSPTFCADLGGDAAKKPCDGVYKKASGTGKPVGAVCERDSECAPQADGKVVCSFNGTSENAQRVCVLQLRGKEGDTCGGNQYVSPTALSGAQAQGDRVNLCWEEDALHCTRLGNGNVSKCNKRSAIGGECFASEPTSCVTGSYCDEKTPQKCAALAAIGGDCTQADGCAEGAYCDPTAKKCAASVPPGGACTANIECSGSFASCTNGKCEGGNLGLSLFFCSQ